MATEAGEMATNARAASKIPQELDEILEQVVQTSPYIASESAFLRHGLRLAIQDALDRDLVTDPALRERCTKWLTVTAQQIGEPVGRN